MQQSLTALRERLMKIEARAARRGRSITFQKADVALPRMLIAEILADRRTAAAA